MKTPVKVKTNSYSNCLDSLSVAQGLLTLDSRNHFMHCLQLKFHSCTGKLAYQSGNSDDYWTS